MIELSEDSDLEIERFLAEEYPLSYGLCPDKPYDYDYQYATMSKGQS
jgi:hypothetical protein